MRKNNQYDERQLYIRGKAFQYAWTAFIIEIVVLKLLQSFEMLSVEPLGEMCILISIPALILMPMLIFKDASDPINGRPGCISFTLLSVSGICMIISKILEGAVFFSEKHITDEGGMLILYLTIFVITILYWAALITERKKEKLENIH